MSLSSSLRLIEAQESQAGLVYESNGIKVHRGGRPTVRMVEINGDQRMSLVAASPASFGFRVTVPRQGSFRFALAVRPPRAPVQIRLLQRQSKGTTTLYEEQWQRERGWVERRVDLSHLKGQYLELELALDGAEATVSFANPEIVGVVEESRPNVILYVVDCLRPDHVGAYGYPRPTTPEIDKLAEDSVIFETAYSCASWTKASTGCLFTSLHPPYHGAQTVDDVLDSQVVTIADLFRERGYATSAWSANPLVHARSFGLTRGFDRVIGLVKQSPGENLIEIEPDAADITRSVVPWLEQNRDRRFFLYLHSLDLHYAYRPRPPFDDLFVSSDRQGLEREMDLYDNEIAYNDHEIGKLLSALRRLGLYDDALIVVTADHGEEFNEHGYLRHGHTLYEAAIRIPLILKLPGSRHQGLRVGEPVGNIDIAPTLLSYAGIPSPESFQGLSWQPFIEEGLLPERQRLYAEQLSSRDVLYAARGKRFKYIYRLLPEPEELLFDLEQDPGEQKNLLPSESMVTRELKQDLLGYLQMAQGGYHLSIAHPDPESWVHVEAWTDARFTHAQRFSIALEEELAITPDGKKLDYRFRAAERRRHLLFDTEPTGAPVHFRLSVEGQPLSRQEIKLGGNGAHPRDVPFLADAAGTRVSLEEATELLKAPGAQARLWYLLAPVERTKTSLDPELERQLRALGYIP